MAWKQCLNEGWIRELSAQAICSGNMKLEEAQQEIATNWHNYWMRVKN
ncbi:MAG: hypothetical protein ABI342_09795 [Nitrososphaera sp.]